MNEDSVAIIPARGGSKRLPGKNIRDFAGKPMIAHSILAARASGLFGRIVVSTDSDEIAGVAETWGAEAPFRRPPDLANDTAVIDAVMLHALQWLESHKANPRYACCIFATAPFLCADDLRRGLDLLREARATSAFTVTRFGYPIFRALRLNEKDRLEMFWPEHRLTRSQDLPEALHDAGQFYWVDVPKYRAEGRIFSSDAVPVLLPPWRVQDIDTPEDWERAERMHAAMGKHPA